MFGENLTTVEIDVNGAVTGERWLISESLVLQPTFARMPAAPLRND